MNTRSDGDAYRLLGLDPAAAASCDAEQVKRAYQRRLLQLHPDKQSEHSGTGAASRSNRAAAAAAGVVVGPAAAAADVGAELEAVRRAYEVLRHPQRRAEYDAGLLLLDDAAGIGTRRRTSLAAAAVVDAEIDLDVMRYHHDDRPPDDNAAAADAAPPYYTYPCRCGGDGFRVSEAELLAGVEHVGCGSCTLVIRVLCADLEDEDGSRR